MQTRVIASFEVVGISVRTEKKDGQAIRDIGALWNRFMTESVQQNIPNKSEETIYAVYTNYEGDYTQPYDLVLGCKVESTDAIPEGMTSVTIQGGNYHSYTSRGNILAGSVANTWKQIWDSETNRSYTTDFEVYGEKARDPQNAEVDILISTKD